MLFTSFVGGSTQYTAIYSGFAIVLVFMLWLYLSWIILLVGASIAFYHQNPEYLVWQQRDIRLSTRQREQLALQAMVDIARAHDRQTDLQTSLDNLARQQRIPAALLLRVLDALQKSGLVQQSADDPPRYLPGYALDRLRIAEIVRSARQASTRNRGDGMLRGDDSVIELLDGLDSSLDTYFGEMTLADFIHRTENSETANEDRLV